MVKYGTTETAPDKQADTVYEFYFVTSARNAERSIACITKKLGDTLDYPPKLAEWRHDFGAVS